MIEYIFIALVLSSFGQQSCVSSNAFSGLPTAGENDWVCNNGNGLCNSGLMYVESTGTQLNKKTEAVTKAGVQSAIVSGRSGPNPCTNVGDPLKLFDLLKTNASSFNCIQNGVDFEPFYITWNYADRIFFDSYEINGLTVQSSDVSVRKTHISKDLKKWNLLGSNDNVNFNLIETRDGVQFSDIESPKPTTARGKTFYINDVGATIGTPVRYKYVRLEVLSPWDYSVGGKEVSFQEIRLKYGYQTGTQTFCTTGCLSNPAPTMDGICTSAPLCPENEELVENKCSPMECNRRKPKSTPTNQCYLEKYESILTLSCFYLVRSMTEKVCVDLCPVNYEPNDVGSCSQCSSGFENPHQGKICTQKDCVVRPASTKLTNYDSKKKNVFCSFGEGDICYKPTTTSMKCAASCPEGTYPDVDNVCIQCSGHYHLVENVCVRKSCTQRNPISLNTGVSYECSFDAGEICFLSRDGSKCDASCDVGELPSLNRRKCMICEDGMVTEDITVDNTVYTTCKSESCDKRLPNNDPTWPCLSNDEIDVGFGKINPVTSLIKPGFCFLAEYPEADGVKWCAHACRDAYGADVETGKCVSCDPETTNYHSSTLEHCLPKPCLERSPNRDGGCLVDLGDCKQSIDGCVCNDSQIIVKGVCQNCPNNYFKSGITCVKKTCSERIPIFISEESAVTKPCFLEDDVKDQIECYRVLKSDEAFEYNSRYGCSSSCRVNEKPSERQGICGCDFNYVQGSDSFCKKVDCELRTPYGGVCSLGLDDNCYTSLDEASGGYNKCVVSCGSGYEPDSTGNICILSVCGFGIYTNKDNCEADVGFGSSCCYDDVRPAEIRCYPKDDEGYCIQSGKSACVGKSPCPSSCCSETGNTGALICVDPENLETSDCPSFDCADGFTSVNSSTCNTYGDQCCIYDVANMLKKNDIPYGGAPSLCISAQNKRNKDLCSGKASALEESFPCANLDGNPDGCSLYIHYGCLYENGKCSNKISKSVVLPGKGMPGWFIALIVVEAVVPVLAIVVCVVVLYFCICREKSKKILDDESSSISTRTPSPLPTTPTSDGTPHNNHQYTDNGRPLTASSTSTGRPLTASSTSTGRPLTASSTSTGQTRPITANSVSSSRTLTSSKHSNKSKKSSSSDSLSSSSSSESKGKHQKGKVSRSSSRSKSPSRALSPSLTRPVYTAEIAADMGISISNQPHQYDTEVLQEHDNLPLRKEEPTKRKKESEFEVTDIE